MDAACLDVSVNGLFIRAGQEFAKGEVVEVALELPDGTRLHCQGRVMREDPRPVETWRGRGYGVRIEEIDAEALGRLRGWLEHLSGAPMPHDDEPQERYAPRVNEDCRPQRRSPDQLRGVPARGRDTGPVPRPGTGPVPRPRAGPSRSPRPPRRRIGPQELQRVLLRLKRKRAKG